MPLRLYPHILALLLGTCSVMAPAVFALQSNEQPSPVLSPQISSEEADSPSPETAPADEVLKDSLQIGAGQISPLQKRRREMIEKYKRRFRFKKAIRELEKYQEDHPQDPWAFWHLAESHLMLLQYPQAEENALQLVEMAYEQIASLLILGEIYERWGKIDLARTIYGEVLQLAPGSSKVHYEAGMFYGRMNEFDQAGYQLELALRLRPNNQEYLFAYGGSLESQGKLEEALKAYKRFLELKYTPPELYYHLGDLYIKKEQYELAVESFLKLDAAMPDTHRNLMALGKSFTGVKDYTKAFDAFFRAHQKFPRKPESLLAMGQMAHQMGQLDRALQIFRRVLVLDDDNTEALFGRARVFSEQGALDKAEYEARQAADLLTRNCRIRALLAALYQAMEKPAASGEEMKMAEKYCPHQAKDYFELYLKRILEKKSEEPGPLAGLPEEATAEL